MLVRSGSLVENCRVHVLPVEVIEQLLSVLSQRVVVSEPIFSRQGLVGSERGLDCRKHKGLVCILVLELRVERGKEVRLRRQQRIWRW